MGDRSHYLALATRLIDVRVGRVLAKSPSWETTPVGPCDGLFLNAALLCESLQGPESAMAELLAIEADMGRVRGERWGSRIIDLDLLLALDIDGVSVVLRSDRLTLPHPLMLERDFVLIPATAIAGDWLHPISGTSLSEALAELMQKGTMTALRIVPSAQDIAYASTNSCARPIVN